MQQAHRSAAVDNTYDSHRLDKSHDDDVSDISEDEDFLQGDGDHGHNVASMKKFRVFWNQQKEEYLLRCYNYYRLTSSSDHGLKGKSWKRIALRMTQEFNEEYDAKSCRNKMNVLRTDYAIYKEILEVRAAGKETDEFWNQVLTKTPRAVKWKDSPFPYYETLRRILEDNGAGVEPLPYLEIQEVPANAQLPPPPSSTKKRPREAPLGSQSPRKRPTEMGHHDFGHQLGSSNEPPAVEHTHHFNLESATEIILQRIKDGFDGLADLIKSTRYNQHLENSETVKSAMMELNKEQYKPLMDNPSHRDIIFQTLKDVNNANAFLLYPDAYKRHFLEDLLKPK